MSDELYDQVCKGMLWVLRKNHADSDAGRTRAAYDVFSSTHPCFIRPTLSEKN